MSAEREAMARACEAIAVFGCTTPEVKALVAAAAELRKCCVTCQHFYRDIHESGYCLIDKAQSRRVLLVPADGSGFCHRHSPKPAQETT